MEAAIATLVPSLPPTFLASYLPFEGPDLRYIYGLVGAAVLVYLAMVCFRAIGRLREARHVQRSSWRTFDKVAKVKGLSRTEIQILRRILRRHDVKRPTQVLSAIVTYDRLVDQAADRGWLEDDEHGYLESARQKLVRTSRVWDGHTNRRQFERAPCSFELGVIAVAKEDIDEELKTVYEEGDEKFRQAMDGLVGERRPEATRVIDLSAGGIALLAADKDQFHIADYLAFSTVDEDAILDLAPIRARILDMERMEDQRQLVLHVRFLPYDAELRKQVIHAVYEESERAVALARAAKGGRGAKAPLRPKKKPRTPPPQDAASAVVADTGD